MSSPHENNSPSSLNGEGSNGIRLPPISFLSGHNNPQGPNRLPQSGSIGISRFLNGPNSTSPLEHSPTLNSDSHVEKKPKIEPYAPNYSQEQSNQKQYSPYLHQFKHNVGTQDAASEIIDGEKANKSQSPVKGSQSGSPLEQHAIPSSEDVNAHQPQNQTQNQNPSPHLHHHHHHHHHHHRTSQNNSHHHHHHHHRHLNNRSADSNVQSPSQVRSEEELGTESKPVATPAGQTQVENTTENINNEQSKKEGAGDKSSEKAPDLPKPDHNGLQLEKRSTDIKPVIPFPPVALDIAPIQEILEEYFPARKFLGAIVYNPTTTWSTLQTSQLYGLKPEHRERFEDIKESFEERIQDGYARANVRYISTIPPLTNDYINYILEIKIPSRFINDFKQNFERDAIRKRTLWGGASGVYSDDSDILSVLAHLGLFTDSVDLRTWNPTWKQQDIITVPEEDGDLSVQLLLLPNLPQYYGYYANGINARSWIGVNKHSGLSMAVYNVKWESQGSYLGDPAIFKRYRNELIQDTKEVFEDEKFKRGWSFNYNYYKELKQKHSHTQTKKLANGSSELPKEVPEIRKQHLTSES